MSLVNSHLLYAGSAPSRALTKQQQQRQQELINKQREAAFNACVNGVFNEKSRKPAIPSKHTSKSHKWRPQRRSTWTILDANNAHVQLNSTVNSADSSHSNVQHKSQQQLTHSVQTAQLNELYALHSSMAAAQQPQRGASANAQQHRPRKKWVRQVSLPLFSERHSDSDNYEDDFVEEQVLRPLSTNVSRQTTPNVHDSSHTVDDNDDTVEVVEIEVDTGHSENELELTMYIDQG